MSRQTALSVRFLWLSMVGEIEEKFDVEVEEREVVNVKTVKDAVDYIQSLQAE